MHIHATRFHWYSKWKGLLGEKRAKQIFFRTRWGIHTFGLFYPIDVVILNKEGVVHRTKKNLLPNRFFLWNPLFDGVLELPAGTIAKKGIQVGRKVTIDD